MSTGPFREGKQEAGGGQQLSGYGAQASASATTPAERGSPISPKG